jgi:hypothetical protein
MKHMAPAPEGPDSGTHAGVTGAPADPPDLGALSAWAPELAKTFASLASDIALVIDGPCDPQRFAQGGTQPLAPAAYAWVGRPWIDTVSGDTRTKIENLLNEVAATGIARRREVNHPLSPGSSIPVAYTAVRLGANGPVASAGLRAISPPSSKGTSSRSGRWNAATGRPARPCALPAAVPVATDAASWSSMPRHSRSSKPTIPAAQLFIAARAPVRARSASLRTLSRGR